MPCVVQGYIVRFAALCGCASKRWMKHGTFRKSVILLVSFLVSGRAAQAQSANPVDEEQASKNYLRIERPTEASTALFRFSEITDGFRLWVKLYGKPGFCPVVICNGSCKFYSDRCSFNSDDSVLGHFSAGSGCGGGCSSSASGSKSSSCCDSPEDQDFCDTAYFESKPCHK